MRLLPITLCFLLAGSAMAQRHGGGISGGGFRGGGMGGIRGGGIGGFHPGGSGGFRGGNFGGFRGFSGFHNGFGSRTVGVGVGFGGYYPGYYGGFGSGFYGGGYDSYSPYDYGYGGGYGYASPAYYQPNVTVVYPQEQQYTAPVYVERPRPQIREYDEYGQEVRPSAAGGGEARTNASPIYLFAFQDHVIRAASSYTVEGRTLHYVTLQHEAKMAPLDSLDRSLTTQLNRERRITVNLP